MGTRLGDRCRLTGAFFNPSIFNNFRECGDFFDINLFTDEGSLPAHKVILSACSDFFREKLRLMQPSWTVSDPLFNGGLQTAPVMTAIYLSGISYANLQSVLDFIYKGDVSISVERLDDFLSTAHKLQVNGLLTESQKEHKDTSLDPATGYRDVYHSPAKETRTSKRRAARQTQKSTSLSVSEPIEREMSKQRDEDMNIKDEMEQQQQQHQEQQQHMHQQQHQQVEETVIVTADESMEVISEATKEGEVEGVVEGEEVTLEVVDVGFGMSSWRIEMADDKDDVAGCNDVLIDGKKVKHFIEKRDKNFHCQLCDHHSKDKSNLVRHLKRRHTQPTHELCPHCGKTYKNKECLYNHMSSKRCLRGAGFNPRDPRILSFLRFDSEDKRWTCTACDNKYRQKVYAREHVVFKHLGIDSLADSQDAETLMDPTISKRIEFVANQNKWKCLACNKLFTNTFNVSHHIQTKHSEDATGMESDPPSDDESRDSNS